jgi:hypothetical protein
MTNHVKIVVVNETDFGFAATGDNGDFVMETGTLAAGSGLPPPVLQPKQTCDFTVQTPIGGPGPEGYLRYEFESLKMRVWILWNDSTKSTPGKVVQENGEDVLESSANPFYYQWRLLDGGFGDLDAPPVKLTDEKGNPWNFDQGAEFHKQDKAEQAKTDAKGNQLDGFKTLVATYTLRVKNTKVNVAPPAVKPAVMPSGVVRPTGAGKAVIGAKYRTWDAPGISPKRKKLLAIIGNQYPQIYAATQAEVGGVDPHGKVPFQWMLCWKPGDGSTSCTNVNTMLEGLALGAGGKWGFAQYHLEEAWVPWAGNPAKPMPNVGDIFLLYRDIVADQRVKVTDSPHLRHCGVILYVPEKPGEDWICADGGQMMRINGDAAFLNRRPWALREPKQPDAAKQQVWDNSMISHPFAAPIKATEYPYLAGGAESQGGLDDANRLLGWLDLDSPAIRFTTEAFDKPLDQPRKIRQMLRFTEYDYQFLGAWIDDLIGKRPGALDPWREHLKTRGKSPPPWKPEGAA